MDGAGEEGEGDGEPPYEAFDANGRFPVDGGVEEVEAARSREGNSSELMSSDCPIAFRGLVRARTARE